MPLSVHRTINSVLLPNFLLPLIIRSQDTCIYDLEGEQQGVGGGQETTGISNHQGLPSFDKRLNH